MIINIDNQFTFILNISLSVFIGLTVYSLTNEWIKTSINWLVATAWKRIVLWWIMRDPPFIEVLASTNASEVWSNEVYLDIDKYLKTQSQMPGTNLRLAAFMRGKHRGALYGKRLNLDLKDKSNTLGVYPMNGALLSDKSIRIIKEHALQRDYTHVSVDLSVSPREKFDQKSFEFEYRILGTRITGKSVLKISTNAQG